MTLRELFINWLTASRFIKTLEMNAMVQRSDFLDRLLEKDGLIKQLRAELAASKLECDRMRTVLMPYASPGGAEFARRFDVHQVKPAVVPQFSGPDDWQAELNKMYQQEEKDGVSGERREIIHEQTADDGA
jgi:hypothetical protein